MPSECASIGQSPGPTDHLYNAGSGRNVGLTHGLLPVGLGRSQPTNRLLECMGDDHRTRIVRVVTISNERSWMTHDVEQRAGTCYRHRYTTQLEPTKCVRSAEW